MKLGNLFRTLSPLVLIGICLLVWFERWIPGASAFTERLGQDFLLRFCIGLLALYVLLLWGESLRLHAMLTSVLKALHEFGRQRREEAGADGKRLEAVRLLVAALESEDPGVRRTGRQHLARLVGEDLGDDPAAWRGWLRGQEARAERGTAE
jgi:hypothetical protein